MAEEINRGYPYCGPDDDPDVPYWMQRLAEEAGTDVQAIVDGIAADKTTTAGTATLDGGFYAPYGTPYDAPSWTKRPDKTVRLAGMIGAAGSTMAMNAGTLYLLGTFPAATFPAANKVFAPATSVQMGPGRLYLQRNTGTGLTEIRFETAANFNVSKGNFFISLDGLNYAAAT